MREILLAYSDDADDAAMFLAIERGLIQVPGVRFRHFRSDIATLNGMASRGEADVCAVSVAHIPGLEGSYDLLPHGGSVGRGYGPVLVAPSANTPLRRVSVPGASTTAAAVLRLAMPEVEQVEAVGASMEQNLAALRAGEVDGAVLVHEGRLVYQQHDLVLRLDLGVWWEQETGLPLPLGANVIRSDLDRELTDALVKAIGESIDWAAANREEVLDALAAHGVERGLDREGLNHYLDLYANDDTSGYDDACQRAIAELLHRASATEG